ncbi:nuclear transport factor 2 family protein [Paraliomyxa miuraensis]|uniref:nuclear transport factor 2 family protein n=1 Tax=Paraliomyxa miuraensis TaxID=376150 RepID=UPI002251E097|nr:nuclear transport factor 2 family protein [Paraliomyxa miuraensis]MCX4242633.1 nuclear transport factor 2 family protein [Paraliomyxa miuraensis]
MPSPPDLDPLAIVEASPAAVLRKDQSGWVGLFSSDAFIEDPVGAARYTGPQRMAAFWRVFIAPQRSVVFRPRREFVSPTVVVRQVTIETVTPVAAEPLEVEAILEYRLRGSIITSMRAFWNPRGPVIWHLQRGLRGWLGLVRHGGRLLTGLGPGAALAFGRAMMPALSPQRAQSLFAELAAAPRDAWLQTMRDVNIEAIGLPDQSGPGHEPTRDPTWVWAGLRGEGGVRRVEAVTIGGSHAAAILTGNGPDVAAIARVEHGRIAELLLLGGSSPRSVH